MVLEMCLKCNFTPNKTRNNVQGSKFGRKFDKADGKSFKKIIEYVFSKSATIKRSASGVKEKCAVGQGK